MEANLSKVHAGHAPSHRHGWKMGYRPPDTAPLRRKSTDSPDEDEEEGNISKLAMSMPMSIALPKSQKKPAILPMERKTSWSDRPEFVPPLLAAMRQRGVAIGESDEGSDTPRGADRTGRGLVQGSGAMPRRSSRSASASREREQARSLAQDPGPVLESLADAVEDDEDEEQEGTFVPPHVLASRASQDGGPEVGWRSLARS
jgi:hypothetical protein